MIEALYNIGKYYLNGKLLDDEGIISVLIENPASTEAYKHVFTVKIKIEGSDIQYTGVSLEEFSSSKIPKYLYSAGGSSGPDITITSRITTSDKTKKTKFEGWCKQDHSSSDIGLTKEEQNFLLSLKKVLIDHKDQIFNEINPIIDQIKKNNESAIVTVVFEDHGKKYIGDYSVFRKILLAKGISTFYNKHETESRSFNQFCSVCKEIVPEVYGFVNTFNFYTVDKPGMVAGGFNQAQAWKDYPVCKTCALILKNGKKYLKESALYDFYGFSYYLIPKPIFKTSISDVLEILARYQKEGSKLKLTKKYRNLLDETKEDVFDCLSERKNSFLLNILIFKEKNAEFKILLYIEDIFPSRLRILFDAKDKVDSHNDIISCEVPIFENQKQIGKIPLKFSFRNYQYFFGKKENKDSYFLDLIKCTFLGRSVSYPFLMWAIVDKIREQFRKDHQGKQRYPTKEACMRGISVLLYLNDLGILKNYSKSDSMNEQQSSVFDSVTPRETNKIAEKIFDDFKPFFNQNAKKAIFLEGALAQLLLHIQYQEREATPFRVKLQGLKLDQRTIQKLLPEIQNKLEEYKKNYYSDLERLISEYMIAAGERWELSKDEISFYFVLGMNLSSHFKVKSENESR